MHIMDRMQCIDVPPITTHLTRIWVSVLCRQAKVNDVHQIALFRYPHHEVVGRDAAMHNRLGMHILYAADLYATAVQFSYVHQYTGVGDRCIKRAQQTKDRRTTTAHTTQRPSPYKTVQCAGGVALRDALPSGLLKARQSSN